MSRLSKASGATPGQERRHSNPDFVDALARGLEVIEAFDAEAPEMTLTEIARRTGLSPATARRSLLTLKELGYVGTNGRHFLLRSKVLLLGGAYLSSMNLRDVAEPHLQDVAESFHDATSMSVLEGMYVLYVAHVPSRREARFRVRIGTRSPAYANSMGHILLASLDEEARERFLSRAPFQAYTTRTTTEAEQLRSIFQSARENGYAAVQDQVEYGSIAIAVPITDSRGRVLAAINCSAETSRVNMEKLVETRLPVLRQASRQISDAIARYPALAHSIVPED